MRALATGCNREAAQNRATRIFVSTLKAVSKKDRQKAWV
jgi:hypothetical protein